MPGNALIVEPEGFRPRADAPDMSDATLTKLFAAAALITDDVADQVNIVTLACTARITPDQLRRKAEVLVDPDRGTTLPDVVRSHFPQPGGKVPSHNPNGTHHR